MEKLNMTTTKTYSKQELEDQRDGIRYGVEANAHWRQRLATEFPQDDRNRFAAEILERLAETVADVSDDTIAAFIESWERDSFKASEHWNELLKGIGFHSAFDTAEEALRDFGRQHEG
jgi:hypothetical protein